jgi:hypothetical protein
VGQALDHRLSCMAGMGVAPSQKCHRRAFEVVDIGELAPPSSYVSPQFEVDCRATCCESYSRDRQLITPW